MGERVNDVLNFAKKEHVLLLLLLQGSCLELANFFCVPSLHPSQALKESSFRTKLGMAKRKKSFFSHDLFCLQNPRKLLVFPQFSVCERSFGIKVRILDMPLLYATSYNMYCVLQCRMREMSGKVLIVFSGTYESQHI